MNLEFLAIAKQWPPNYGTNLKLISTNSLVPYSSYLVCYHQNYKQMESVTLWTNRNHDEKKTKNI